MRSRTRGAALRPAGPAGLLAARSLKHAGIPYAQFDKNDEVGGIWDIKNDWSPMYETAHFISSKTVSNLPGFDMPVDYPDYPNHQQILSYLIVFATGYKVTYPYMDKNLFEWMSKCPDLYLSSLHREFDNVCCLGLHQTDGGAYDFFTLQADMMCNFILDQEQRPKWAAKFHDLKKNDRPKLSGKFKWKSFGTMQPPAADSNLGTGRRRSETRDSALAEVEVAP